MLKIQIKKNRKGLFEYSYLLLCILLEYHLFYLIPYRGLISNLLWIYSRAFLGAIISFGYLIVNKKGNIKNTWLNRFCVTLFVCITVELVYSMIIYPSQSLIDTIRVASAFLMPATAIIFLGLFEKHRDVKQILEAINRINIVWCILVIIQSVLYKNDIIFMDFESLFLGEEVYMRYGSFRVYAAVFADCMIIYNFSVLYQSRKDKSVKWFTHLFAFVIGVYCMFAINQTKAEQVYVLTSVGLIILIGGKTIRSKVVTIVAIMGAVFLIYNTEYMARIMSIFGSEMSESHSVSHRLYAYEYYAECIKNNPIWGNGFAMTTSILNPYYSVEHGPSGFAYYSDVGVVGLVANTGLFSIIIYFIPMIHIGRNVYKIVKASSVKEKSFELAFFLYLCISSITLITTDAHRMIQFAFAIAFYEYMAKSRKGILICRV